MPATLVDHIIPSEDDWDDRSNPRNLEALCTACHYSKTKRETAKRKKGAKRSMTINVVAGYPASGKSTYVYSHAGKHDLIFDYDELMHVLTGLPMHQSNINAHDYVTLIREMLLRKLKAEQTFDNVWIITTFPDNKIDSLLVSHKIKHLFIDETKENCIKRIAKQKRNVNEATKLITKMDLAIANGEFNGFARLRLGEGTPVEIIGA